MRARVVHAAKISAVVVFAVALSAVLWIVAIYALFSDFLRGPFGPD